RLTYRRPLIEKPAEWRAFAFLGAGNVLRHGERGLRHHADRTVLIVESGFHQSVAVGFHAAAGFQADPFAARRTVQVERDVGVDGAGALVQAQLPDAVAKVA